ncbi:MAG TPA: PGPGW domain-containing protein [Polyangiaceae bacterium]
MPLREHALGFGLSALVAFVLGVAATLLVPRAIARLPADHFVRPVTRKRRAVRFARWIIGGLLTAAGVAMLVLPGPGMAAIVIGLVVLDLPLLRRLAVHLLRRPGVAKAVTRIREKYGRPPLLLPPEAVEPPKDESPKPRP